MSPRSRPPMRLMPLRDELTLHEGPRTLDGAPTWTLHDPVTNRFFRIGWLEFEILSRWDLGDIEQIAADIAARTTIPATAAQVENFARFLVAGNLIQARGPDCDRALQAAGGGDPQDAGHVAAQELPVLPHPAGQARPLPEGRSADGGLGLHPLVPGAGLGGGAGGRLAGGAAVGQFHQYLHAFLHAGRGGAGRLSRCSRPNCCTSSATPSRPAGSAAGCRRWVRRSW